MLQLNLASNGNLSLGNQTNISNEMEEDLKISNVEYLSNHWLHLTKILNIILGDQKKLYKSFKWIQMEDDVKILKGEFHINQLLDLSQIWSLLWGAHIKCYKTSNCDDLKWLKLFIPATNPRSGRGT